jgi:hypothetical protein
MPVATTSLRTSSSPNDPGAAGGGRPPTGPRAGSADDVEIAHGEMLVVGYLSAVAAALRERGITATTMDGLGIQQPDRPGVLCGTLNLRAAGQGPGWGPTQVDWHQDTGWSARLRRGINGHLTIWRYLHSATVPTPGVVAGFVAALAAGEDVGSAAPSRLPGRRRTLIARLNRFAATQPCRAAAPRPRGERNRHAGGDDHVHRQRPTHATTPATTAPAATTGRPAALITSPNPATPASDGRTRSANRLRVPHTPRGTGR